MIYQINNIFYDSDNGNISIDSAEINLTKTQSKLLNYLIENPKEIISKQTLMDEVWGRRVSDNSVDQIILILRGYLESDPTKPKILMTHFGRGISFEAHIEAKSLPSKPIINFLKSKYFYTTVFTLILMTVIWSLFVKSNKKTTNLIGKDQQILILPIKFDDESISNIQQKGIESLFNFTFKNLETEGELIFDQVSYNAQQAIEKHWQLDNNLIVLSSEVIKNGEIYEAIIKLTSGSKTIKSTTLRANRLEGLLNQQISFISSIKQPINTNTSIPITPSTNDLYIQALGYIKIRKLDKARQLLENLINNQEDDFMARFTLSEVFILQKNYIKAESQLKALKATSAYLILATEIELSFAKIELEKHEYTNVISNLINFQISHPAINKLKKAKIKILIAKSYLALGDAKNSLLFYQQSLVDVDESFNPGLFFQSYYGQGKVLQTQSNDETILELFEKSLNYAQIAGDYHQQVLALNEISSIALSNYQWEKAIEIKKQALQIMELDNNKEEIANGLGTLVAILILRGNFSEAQKVNERLGKITKELNSEALLLHYLHYDSVLAMNFFDWRHARIQIDKQLKLAQKNNNYSMQLDNAFLEMELLLALKETSKFKKTWDERVALIAKQDFTRYQIYMDVYLIRYYNLINKNEVAIQLIEQTSKQALVASDINVFVDAQNQLAEIYLKNDAQKALVVLNNLEQHNPQPNPYLEIKARALNKLGKHIDALNVLNQAKLVYNESWTSQNQILLDSIKSAIKKR